MPIPITFEAYYDSDKKGYWIRDSRGMWVEVNMDTLRLKLRCLGGSDKKVRGGVSEIDRYISDLITTHNVSYAGPVAGHRCGITIQNGNPILVSSSPVLIDPVPGPWPRFKRLLDELLDDEEYRQSDYFHGWLLTARRALISGDYKPGQCLVFAGPVDCGKSFLQNRITLLLGGRAAKPYLFMAKDTPFNKELFGAEHLMIEDVISSTDIRARRAFGARIKEFTVNEVQSCHGKHRDGVNVNPFWRVTITVNDEPEDLMVLPPMIDSVADKFILLKVNKATFPDDTDTFRQMIDAELPHYVHWLHHEWKMPDEIVGRRFGVASFQHPVLLSSINDLSPEHELLMLINTYCFRNGQNLWKGTASDLSDYLSTVCEKRSSSLLKWGQACATYLGRLSKQFPERFIYVRSKHERSWEIRCSGDTLSPPKTCSNEVGVTQ